MHNITARGRLRPIVWLVLAALVVLGAGIGLRAPWPPDEPRFVLIAHQMLAQGHWLFPHRGIELYADKPPLYFWSQAAMTWLTAGWRGGFLLVPLLSGVLTLVVVFRTTRRLWDEQTALVAALLVLATVQFVDTFKHAQIDPLLVLWVTLGNAGLLVHFLRGPDWRAYWLGCMAAGLGVITKGVGILVFLMAIPYLLVRWRGWPDVLRTRGAWVRWLAGVGMFLLPIALWLAPMLAVAHREGSSAYLAYVQDLLFHQTGDRYARSWAHHAPVWFFALVMLRDWFPITLLLPWTIPAWRRAWEARDARWWLPLGSWMLALLFFTLPAGKREVYLLPALPMAAMSMAPAVVPLLRTRWLPRAAFLLTVLIGVLFVAVGTWAMLAHPRAAARVAQGYELGEHAQALWWCVMAVGVAVLVCAAALRPARGAIALVVALGLGWIVWSVGTYPLLDDNQSAQALMRRADAAVGPNGKLGLVQWREELLLQARRPVADFGFSRPLREQLQAARAWQAQAPGRRWVMVDLGVVPGCVEPSHAVPLGLANRKRWWLVDGGGWRSDCHVE